MKEKNAGSGELKLLEEKFSPLRDYCQIVVGRIEEAGERGNRAEAARLLRLFSDVCAEEARKLEASADVGATGGDQSLAG